MTKTFTKEDVASHSKGESLYIVIDEDVYDVSKFQDEHPGMFSYNLTRARATGPFSWASSDSVNLERETKNNMC